MKQLIIKCNNIGLCPSVNIALKELLKTHLPFSASIFFLSPNYYEAVDILKDIPNVSCGLYLSLTSESSNNRFTTVTNPKLVPSLVDSNKYLFTKSTSLLCNRPKINEIEREIYAQINRALFTGLDIQYLDFHTSLFYKNLEIFNLVIKAANEYKLIVAGLNNEIISDVIYHEPFESKKYKLLKTIEELKDDSINVLVFHIGINSETKPNKILPADFNVQRQAELDALCSAEFRKILKINNIKLTTYKNIETITHIPEKYNTMYKSNCTILYIAKIISKQLIKI